MMIVGLRKDVEDGYLLETEIDANHAWLVRIQQDFQSTLPQCSRCQIQRLIKSREKRTA